ncbi:MAG: threonine/serine exporter family protein [Gemmataceae bacterium]
MRMRCLQTELLVQAGRLLLEYNESTRAIQHALTTTASALTDDACHVVVSYGSVAVSLGGNTSALVPVRELRYNTAVQARVHAILGRVRDGHLEPMAALTELGRVEAETPRHPQWVAILVLGLAATSLAVLLRADTGAAAVAGVATGLGLVVRQALGRRHFSLLTLPLAAALVGAVAGGGAIRLGWTQTPELALVVPALMVVPGPHLINGVLDLIDNYVPMSMARLGLAAGIQLAGALGVVLGVELTVRSPLPVTTAAAGRLDLVSDVVLAGVATCGFAVFYNTTWSQVGLAALGGMVGHGLRYLALEVGTDLVPATLLGGLAVGAVAAGIARAGKIPVAVIAFAGAVPMIPGLHMYRALAGALHIARLANEADTAAVAETLANAAYAGLGISGLALGLILGVRTVQATCERSTAPAPS